MNRINERVDKGETKDNFEIDIFADLVYNIGKYIYKKEKWIGVDATRSPNEIASQIQEVIENTVPLYLKYLESQEP